MQYATHLIQYCDLLCIYGPKLLKHTVFIPIFVQHNFLCSTKLFCIPKHYEDSVGSVLIPHGMIQVLEKLLLTLFLHYSSYS